MRALRSLDRFERLVLGALLALAVSVLVGLLARVWVKGGVISGADGYLVADPMQYLNWLQQAGEHGLISNLYDLEDGPRSFLHPGLLLSGILDRMGFGFIAAYQVWKPVAVGVLFAGALVCCRRFLGDRDDRRLALVLALFACSPVSALVAWGGASGATKLDFDFIGGELWSGAWLWGYLFTPIAVGLLPLAVIAYERGREGGQDRMFMWAAAAGLFCSWFQPWQGATLAAVLVGAEAWLVLRHRREATAAARALTPVLAAIAAPLVYYLVLSKTDASWELAGEANDLPRWSAWVTILGLAPLAVPAAFAYRLPAPDFGDVALRGWPLAALAVYYSPFGTFPFHAFQGLAIPLSVLGVLAWRSRLGSATLPLVPALVVAAVLVVPGTAYRVDEMRKAVNFGLQPHFLTNGENDALRALREDERPGGVLAPVYTGLLVPAYTGRETYVGAGSWSPDFADRELAGERLFSGRMTPAQARRLIRSSGARFLLSDCHGRPDITRTLAGLTGPPRRFGCATIYEVLIRR